MREMRSLGGEGEGEGEEGEIQIIRMQVLKHYLCNYAVTMQCVQV